MRQYCSSSEECCFDIDTWVCVYCGRKTAKPWDEDFREKIPELKDDETTEKTIDPGLRDAEPV